MDAFQIGICEPEDFSPVAIKILDRIGEVFKYNGEDLKLFIHDKDVVFVRLKYLINDDLINNAARLHFICSPTTGLNHIQITREDIEIISLKGEYEFLSSIRATPEHVFGLTIALLRNYSHAFLNKTNAIFDRNLYKGYELYNNSVGIIGMGRVGKIIAKYYSSFGAKVYYYDVEKKDIDWAILCNSIEEVIEKTNIIVLCANYISENEKMMGSRYFELMKNKYFINAARGELVDEMAFLDYLSHKWFAGVAIDVISDETERSDFLCKILPLIDEQNIIVTPHIGGATYSSMERTEVFIAEKLKKIVNGSFP